MFIASKAWEAYVVTRHPVKVCHSFLVYANHLGIVWVRFQRSPSERIVRVVQFTLMVLPALVGFVILSVQNDYGHHLLLYHYGR